MRSMFIVIWVQIVDRMNNTLLLCNLILLRRLVIMRAPTHIRGKSLKNINCSSKTRRGQKKTYNNFNIIMYYKV